MSLRHALLAVLTAEPMTGYDMVKHFDASVAFLWNAPHSQIYPELRRMEDLGLITAEVVPRGQRAEKRVYSISEAGIDEFRRWIEEPLPQQPERNPYRLKAAFFEWASLDAARRQLGEHVRHHTRYLHDWRQMYDDIEARRVPLLRRRMETFPEGERDAIVAFKRFAFEGEIARAEAEIAWAKRGIELIDRLEREHGDSPAHRLAAVDGVDAAGAAD
jgi:PadR family transcriptional regulator AphA